MYKIHNEQGAVQHISSGKVIPNDPSNRDWRKYQAWLAEGNEPEQMDIIGPWIAKRQERNLILTSCDWITLTDSQLTAEERAEWFVYRQELRNLPMTYPDANDIIWPTPPG